MPIYKTKNENFFKKWSPEMAYVLGFFVADGYMTKNKRGACFINFHITDKDLLVKIRKLLCSNHKIAEIRKSNTWKTSYRLQIGSKEIFNDLLGLGITPSKSKTIRLPKIPKKYFSHFVRGYFDGDGNVIFGYFKKADRNKRSQDFLTRFISGSEQFLKTLKTLLNQRLTTTGSLYFGGNNAWQLSYSANDSRKLFNFMYNHGKINDLIFLRRKYDIYLKAGCK